MSSGRRPDEDPPSPLERYKTPDEDTEQSSDEDEERRLARDIVSPSQNEFVDDATANAIEQEVRRASLDSLGSIGDPDTLGVDDEETEFETDEDSEAEAAMQEDTTEDTGEETSAAEDTPAAHASSEESPDHTTVSTEATRTVSTTDLLDQPASMPVGRTRAKEADSSVVELDTVTRQDRHGAENPAMRPIESQGRVKDEKGK